MTYLRNSCEKSILFFSWFLHFSDDFYCFLSDFDRFVPKQRKDTNNVSKYGGHLKSKLDYNLLLSNCIRYYTENAKKQLFLEHEWALSQLPMRPQAEWAIDSEAMRARGIIV